MYAAALSASAAAALPYFHLGSLDVGIPIQSFGMIVAAGVLIGAALLRRYGEWHGVSDDHIRGITGWITVSGFIGAHVFDVIAYQWSDLKADPILFVEVWKGISSYGGFIGGAIGFAIYVWWKRLPPRLMADIGIVGLLPAFSIGRIGCTVVSDHIGAAVDPSHWYAFLAMDYPVREAVGNNLVPIQKLIAMSPSVVHDGMVRAWNLGLIEFLYLVPVNALVLYIAFNSKKRHNAGLIPVLTGVLYAPVRFGLDFLRPEETDPRYAGLTFAQWASFLAFGAAVYLMIKIIKTGKVAETVKTTSGEAQRALKVILKEQGGPDESKAERALKPGLHVGSPARSKPDADDAKLPEATASEVEASDDDEDDDEEAESASKPSGQPGNRKRGKRGGKAARKK